MTPQQQHQPLIHTVEASVRFFALDESHAVLTVRNETPGVFLTLIHEAQADTLTHDCIDITCTEHIEVESGDTLTFIARRAGQVSATQLFEIACDVADLGFILSPRGGFNLIVHQDAVGAREHLHRVHGEEAHA